MNRLGLFLMISVASLLGATLIGLTTRAAEESVTMTEAHIARIRDNCVDAQSTLFQLHASDAGLRVNRGQLYESISTKLIAPFNSRLVLNRISADALLNTATEYDRQLVAFRQRYQQYEEAMSATLKIDCVRQPVAFYESVNDTREKRRLTHESTVDLHRTIQKYGDQVGDIAKTYQTEEK